MKKKIETRELLTLEVSGHIIRGTHHEARNESFCAQSDLRNQDRIGVLLLNSLSPTRAGKGDSSVYWADSFAERGYPTFRLDLPGFGDSDGDPPTELPAFINQGGYAPIVSSHIKEIVARFDLSGVILVGLCAGAVSAIYTAAECRECHGLVLMDPYFYLPRVRRSSIWGKLTGCIPAGALRRLLRSSFHRLKSACIQMPTDKLPSNSNYRLLRHCKELASTRLPILIFTAPAIKQRVGNFDYVDYIREQARNNRIVAQVIQGADHTFANRIGRASVRHYAEVWLNDCFPLRGRGEDAMVATHSKCDSSRSDYKLYKNSSREHLRPRKLDNQEI